jgi:hypothetical protein
VRLPRENHAIVKPGRDPAQRFEGTTGPEAFLVLAVRHDCVCGHPFLICVATEHDDDGVSEREVAWPELVRAAATRIGASYVEAEGNVRFNCTSCGAVLLLLTPRPLGSDVGYPDLSRNTFVGSLN